MCPFCNLNDQTDRIVKEYKNTWVILSNPRLMKGHLLVIPKRHVQSLSELTKKERNELIDTAITFQEKMLSKFSSGCDLRQNNRPFLKQDRLKVDHVHIHVLPREFNDDYYQRCQITEKEIFTYLSGDEINEVVRLLG